MMCILHRDWPCLEAMAEGKRPHFIGVIVGQQEVATKLFAQRKEAGMVNLI